MATLVDEVDVVVPLPLTVEELAAALRLGDSQEEIAEVTRLLAYSTIAVNRTAPKAPSEVLREAAIRLSGYLFDQPLDITGVSLMHMR